MNALALEGAEMMGERQVWADKYSNETISQYDGEFLMIKKDQLKYQYYGTDLPEVLFDLGRDSQEKIDFSQDGEYKQIMKWFREERRKLRF